MCGCQACDTLSGCQLHTWADTNTDTGTHSHTVELACLAHVQGLAMKSAWESSRGPGQDTETETEREKERGRLLSPDKIPLFICPTLSVPPPLHTSLPSPSNPSFSTSSGTRQKPCQSLPGQGRMSVIVKSPHRSNQTLHVRSGNSAVLETYWLYMNNLCSRSAEGKTWYSSV